MLSAILRELILSNYKTCMDGMSNKLCQTYLNPLPQSFDLFFPPYGRL